MSIGLDRKSGRKSVEGNRTCAREALSKDIDVLSLLPGGGQRFYEWAESERNAIDSAATSAIHAIAAAGLRSPIQDSIRALNQPHGLLTVGAAC